MFVIRKKNKKSSYRQRKKSYFCNLKMPNGVIGNTTDSGPVIGGSSPPWATKTFPPC